MRSRPPLLLLAGAAAVTAVVAAPGTASAGSPHDHGPTIKVLDRSVQAPYQLTHDSRSVYVGDGGASTVSKLTRAGLRTVATGPQPGEVAGVAVNRAGDLAYTATNYSTGTTTLTVKRHNGRTVVTDLSAYERTKNPDAKVRYGIDHPTPCQVTAFEPLGGATYTGVVDSHPYAVAALRDGTWVVADAAGNDLLQVGTSGHVHTLAVLPRQPLKITASAAAGLGLPNCVVGAVYNFEPVPTDVEVAPNGTLVVSLLPGGPEDPSLGARGRVVAVSGGRTRTIATGFLGATNLALGDHGRIYVSELFAGRISVIEHGRVRPYVSIASPAGLTYFRGTLYAGTLGPSDEEGNPTGPGTIVAIR